MQQTKACESKAYHLEGWEEIHVHYLAISENWALLVVWHQFRMSIHQISIQTTRY